MRLWLKYKLIAMVAVIVLLPWNASFAQDEASVVEIVEVIEPHALDIRFKGTLVGKRNFEAGEKYEVVRWTEYSVVLKDKKQRFSLPRSKVRGVSKSKGPSPTAAEPTPATAPQTQPTAQPVTEVVSSQPQAAKPAPQSPPTEAPSQKSVQPTGPSVSPAATAPTVSVQTDLVTLSPDVMQPFVDYVQQSAEFRKKDSMQVRFLRYAQKQMNPLKERRQLASLLEDSKFADGDMALVNTLRSAFVMYSRGMWQAYEAKMDEASKLVPTVAPTPTPTAAKQP